MFAFVLTFFDERSGPVPVYWDEGVSKDEAYNIAFKSFVISGSGQGILETTESIVAMPELKKVGFYFFFTIPDERRRGGVFPISISLVSNISNQLETYKKAAIISSHLRELAQVFPRILNDSNKLNRELLLIEVEKAREGITEETKPFEVRAADNHLLVTKYRVDFTKLLERVKQNLDMAIYGLLSGQNIAIVAKSQEEVEEVVGTLILFAPHRQITVNPWVSSVDDLAQHNYDIIGLTPELASEIRDKESIGDFVRINLLKRRVYGGRANRFCQTLLHELEQSLVGHEEVVKGRVNWLLQNTSYFGHLATEDKGQKLQTLIKKVDRDTLYLITSILEQSSPMVAETLERKLGRIQLKGLVEI